MNAGSQPLEDIEDRGWSVCRQETQQDALHKISLNICPAHHHHHPSYLRFNFLFFPFGPVRGHVRF